MLKTLGQLAWGVFLLSGCGDPDRGSTTFLAGAAGDLPQRLFNEYKVATNSEFDSYPALLKGIAQSRYDSLRSQLGAPGGMPSS